MKILIRNPQVLVFRDGLFGIEKKDVFIDGERIAAVILRSKGRGSLRFRT